tara:strand:- start:450 stop:1691 length:1242 start_codon:yes stop_codon:yes gene_type:complete
MKDDKPSVPDPFQTALADWQAGRIAEALAALNAAARSGDTACASLLLQLSADAAAPDGARAEAVASLAAAPDEASFRRHRAYLLASGYGQDADPAAAIDQRLVEARAGDPQAMTEIGLLAALAGDDISARTWLEAASRAGSGHAIAALLRLGIEDGAIHPVARRAMPGLARSGHPLAQPLIQSARRLPDAQIKAEPGHADEAGPQGLLTAIIAAPAPGECLSETPRVERWRSALPAVLCDYLSAGAAPLLQPAQIFDPATRETRPDPYRQSLTAALPEGAMDLVLWAIKRRMAALSGAQCDQGEALAVLVYRPGDHYRPHFDYLTEDGAGASADLDRRGQRISTTLIRLNEEFEGGDTVFPRLDLRWTGWRGDALSFDNVTPDDQGDPRTLHAGESVSSGMKILASLWLRERT